MNYDQLQKFKAELQKEFPGLQFVEKLTDPLMRFLKVILFFVPDFDRVYNGFFGKIYVPRLVVVEKDRPDISQVYAHEAVHISDAHGRQFLFSLQYVFPQILAVLALLSLGAIWGSSLWLWNLGWLVFLAPWPAPWRVEYEARAYAVGDFVLLCKLGLSPYPEWSSAKLAGSLYYWASWNQKATERRIIVLRNLIASGQADQRIYRVLNALDRALS